MWAFVMTAVYRTDSDAYRIRSCNALFLLYLDVDGMVPPSPLVRLRVKRKLTPFSSAHHPVGVLPISSDRGDRRICLGLKFSISGIF